MTRNVMTLAAAFLLACGGNEDSDSDNQAEVGDNPACDNGFVQDQSFPEPAADDVFYRTNVRLVLEEEDTSATVTLEGPDGPVTGQVTYDGRAVIFTPAAPLTATTTYTVTLTYSNSACEPLSFTWTTSEVGAPLTAPIVDNVYELGLADADWTTPAGLGPTIAALAVDVEVLVSPTDDQGGTLSFIGGLGNGDDTQNVCAETFPLDGADFSETPYFSLEADELPFEVAGVAVTIEDLFLSGAFTADGTSMTGLRLEGVVDTVNLEGLLPIEGTICDLAFDLAGASCVECASSGEETCLEVVIENVDAPQVGTGGLQVVTPEDVAGPDCQ